MVKMFVTKACRAEDCETVLQRILTMCRVRCNIGNTFDVLFAILVTVSTVRTDGEDTCRVLVECERVSKS